MITDRSVVLESKDGSYQEWTDWGNLPLFFEEAEDKDGERPRVSYRQETPFNNIESAQQYVELLIEAIEESRRDVDADIALSESDRSERRKQALQLVSNNLAKLSQHMTTSHRIVNDLRTLRRLLLEERQRRLRISVILLRSCRMTLEELSRVSQAMAIQSYLLCFSIDKQVSKEPCYPFCNDTGSLRAPISLQIGLRMDEKSGDE